MWSDRVSRYHNPFISILIEVSSVPTDYRNKSAGTTTLAISRVQARKVKKGSVFLNPGEILEFLNDGLLMTQIFVRWPRNARCTYPH